MRFVLCCNGGNIPEIGTGHISRCSMIARELMLLGKNEVYFVVGKESIRPSRMNNVFTYRADTLKEHEEVFKRLQPDVIVADMLDTEEKFMKLASKYAGKRLVSLDDRGEGAKYAAFTINGNLQGGTYNGVKYVITNPEIIKSKRIMERCMTVFISFGGYDHLGLKIKAVNALADMPFVRVYPNGGRNYAQLLHSADIALTNGGLTMFDSMAAGVPTIAIAQYKHQCEVAKMHKDVIKFLGYGEKVSELDIAIAVKKLQRRLKERIRMSKAGLERVDGKGLERVVKLIVGGPNAV